MLLEIRMIDSRPPFDPELQELMRVYGIAPADAEFMRLPDKPPVLTTGTGGYLHLVVDNVRRPSCTPRTPR
jgi:hypothetical protein